MSKRIFILLFILIANTAAQAQELEFYKEDLNFTIRKGFFYVDGIYYFSNPGGESVRKVLFYPFPTSDTFYGPVKDVSILEIADSNTNRLIKQTRNGAMFAIDLPPYESTKFRIRYTQPVYGNRSEYILTTTQNWGKPLELAHYSLTVPPELVNLQFSIPPDSTQRVGTDAIYYWERKNFIPDTNMIFTFSFREE
jgi:hypothetical protein